MLANPRIKYGWQIDLAILRLSANVRRLLWSPKIVSALAEHFSTCSQLESIWRQRDREYRWVPSEKLQYRIFEKDDVLELSIVNEIGA